MSELIRIEQERGIPSYREEQCPKWWPQQITFQKPNSLKKCELKLVLKNAPLDKLNALCAKEPKKNLPRRQVLSEPDRNVQRMRKQVFEHLKKEDYTGKTRYIEKNKPAWWPKEVKFEKPTHLAKTELIDVVEGLEKLEVTASCQVSVVAEDSPGIPVYYRMNSEVRGMCLAIFNGIFSGKKEFETKEDINIIRNTFEPLHFQCHFYENLTAKGMMEVLNEIAALDHSKYDALVVFIASHGTKDSVVGADNKCVLQEDILHCFTSLKCPTLANKPKLFIMDVCRGSEGMSGLIGQQTVVAPDQTKRNGSEGAGAQDASGMPSYFESMRGPVMAIDFHDRERRGMKPVPELADMVVAHSTCPGYVAHVMDNYGSLFARQFCDDLTKLCKKCTINEILEYAGKKMSNRIYDVKQGTATLQMPQYSSTLRHRWTLFP